MLGVAIARSCLTAPDAISREKKNISNDAEDCGDIGRWLEEKHLIVLALITFFPRKLYILGRYYLFRPILGQDTTLLDVTHIMRGWRGLIGMLARRKVLGVILGAAFGKHVTVYNVLFSKSTVCIGENSCIGFDCNIGNVKIGNKILFFLRDLRECIL